MCFSGLAWFFKMQQIVKIDSANKDRLVVLWRNKHFVCLKLKEYYRLTYIIALNIFLLIIELRAEVGGHSFNQGKLPSLFSPTHPFNILLVN